VSALGHALDLLLAIALPVIALAAVLRRDLFHAVILLFSFGVLLALAWARLGAPDVAMVEAALGAGVTGVLFLSALARTGGADVEARRSLAGWAAVFALCAAAMLPVGLAVASLPRSFEGLLPLVQRETPNSGASHMVTSVLLDFRGYDTLLEIAVLVLAVLGAWAVRGAAPERWPVPRPGPLLVAAVRLILPLAVVAAGVLLWVGAFAPGGAFQAGCVLGTALILASLSGAVRVPRVPDWAVRAVLAVGFAVFLAVAGGTAVASGALLDYPLAHAAGLLLAIEAALTLSIALVMAALVQGRAPAGDRADAAAAPARGPAGGAA
jgi:multisubunit Na+/H+ antiporter MnhB subunit